MPRKPNSNSLLDSLPPNQQAALEAWLFDENLSYKDAASRLWQDFSVRCAPSTLSEWRSRRAQSRTLERIARSSRSANEVTAAFQANPANTYDALLNLIGQATFDTQMSGQSLSLATLKDLAELTQLGLKARFDTESLRIKQEDLDFKRQKFEFDAAEACMKELPKLKAIVADKGLSDSQRIEAIRKKLFGDAAK